MVAGGNVAGECVSAGGVIDETVVDGHGVVKSEDCWPSVDRDDGDGSSRDDDVVCYANEGKNMVWYSECSLKSVEAVPQ